VVAGDGPHGLFLTEAACSRRGFGSGGPRSVAEATAPDLAEALRGSLILAVQGDRTRGPSPPPVSGPSSRSAIAIILET
jgi:hypothetical protein